MTHEEARILMMDALYDELTGPEMQRLQQYLNEHPELREEFEAFGTTRQILSELPAEEPAGRFVMVEPGQSALHRWWNEFIDSLIFRSRMAKAALALSALMLVFFAAAGLSEMNINYSDDGFRMAFGSEPLTPPPVQQGISPEQVQYMLDEMRAENARMISAAVEEATSQQAGEFRQTLLDFASYMEQQRNTDLRLISSGLNSLEEDYNTRYRQTNRMLGEIIQTVQTQE